MKNRYYAILAICALCGTSSLSAATTVDDVLRSIISNNAELKANSASVSTDSIAALTSNNLEDPKVDFEYNFGKEGDKWGIGVSQGFDWPGMYSARSKANKTRIEAMRHANDAKRIELLFKAKMLCLDIIRTNRQLDAQKEIAGIIDALYSRYSKAYENGEASVIDLNKIKIERIEAQRALDEVSTKLKSLTAELTALNNGIDFSAIDLSGLMEYPAQEFASVDTYCSEFKANDPQQAYFASVDATIKGDVNVAKMGWLPKFDLGYQYTNELGEKFNGVTVGASIPIFSNRKKVAGTKAQAIANDLTRQNYDAANLARIKSQFAQAVSLKSQLAGYDEVLGNKDYIDTLQKALNGGQMSLLNYLLELRYFLDAKYRYLDIEYSYNSALTELNKYHTTM